MKKGGPLAHLSYETTTLGPAVTPLAAPARASARHAAIARSVARHNGTAVVAAWRVAQIDD